MTVRSKCGSWPKPVLIVAFLGCSGAYPDDAQTLAADDESGADVFAPEESAAVSPPPTELGTVRQAITGRQRACQVAQFASDWFDVLVVTSSWTEADCDRWADSITGGRSVDTFSRIGCLTEDGFDFAFEVPPFGC